MSNLKKIVLKALERGGYEIEEMIITEDGSILRVIPKHLNKEYRKLNLFIDTCEPGKRPVLLCALGIYNLELPCIVT